MSYRENRFHELKAEAKAILDKADKEQKGEMTDEQTKRVDALNAEMEIIARDLGWGGGRKTTPDPPGHTPGKTFNRQPSGWVDQAGNPVAVLENKETLADSFRSQGLIQGQRHGEPEPRVGEAVRALITGDWPDDGGQIQAALSIGQDGAGGYTLNPAMSSQVIDLARNQSVLFRAGARTVAMPTSELILVKVLSDPSVAWTAENNTIPTSQGTFGRLTFRARKMGTIVKMSRELVEDSPNAAQIIEQQLSAQLALELDRVGLLGDADGEEPVGLFNQADVNSITSVGSPTYDDFLDAIKLVEDDNGTPGAYIYPPSVKNTLAKLKDSNGLYLNPPDDLRQLMRLVTKQLADSQAALGDFRQVLIGIRRNVEIEVSRQAGDAFSDDQVWIKARWRGDVQFEHVNHLAILTGIS